MSKSTPKKTVGRPAKENAKSVLVSFRIDARTAAAIDRLREGLGVLSFSISDTAREVLLRALKADGLLPDDPRPFRVALVKGEGKP